MGSRAKRSVRTGPTHRHVALPLVGLRHADITAGRPVSSAGGACRRGRHVRRRRRSTSATDHLPGRCRADACRHRSGQGPDRRRYPWTIGAQGQRPRLGQLLCRRQRDGPGRGRPGQSTGRRTGAPRRRRCRRLGELLAGAVVGGEAHLTGDDDRGGALLDLPRRRHARARGHPPKGLRGPGSVRSR